MRAYGSVYIFICSTAQAELRKKIFIGFIFIFILDWGSEFENDVARYLKSCFLPILL